MMMMMILYLLIQKEKEKKGHIYVYKLNIYIQSCSIITQQQTEYVYTPGPPTVVDFSCVSAAAKTLRTPFLCCFFSFGTTSALKHTN